MKYVQLFVLILVMTSCIGTKSDREEINDNPINLRLIYSGVETEQDDWWCSGRHFYFEFELKNNYESGINVHSSFLNNFCTENKSNPDIRLYLKENMIEKYTFSEETVNLGYVPLEITNLFNDSLLSSGETIKIRVSDNTWSSASDSLIHDRLAFLEMNASNCVFKGLFDGQTDDLKFRFVQE